LNIKEAQSRQPLRDGVRSQIQGTEHRSLILPDVFRAKTIRWTMKVPSEVLDRADVSANGGLGVVAPLQLFQHDLT
jgi:hypothetical protein